MESTAIFVFTVFGLAASSFVATNLDNLLLLVALQGSHPGRRLAVQLGFLSAAVLLLLFAALGLLLGQVLDPAWLGYLGLVPLLLGCRMLYLAWSSKHRPADTVQSLSAFGGSSVWLATLALMLSNSGDSLAVLLPLLAETGKPAHWLLMLSYLLMALLWSGLSLLLVSHRGMLSYIERYGEKLVPWIMIGVGCYILLDTSTDTLF